MAGDLGSSASCGSRVSLGLAELEWLLELWNNNLGSWGCGCFLWCPGPVVVNLLEVSYGHFFPTTLVVVVVPGEVIPVATCWALGCGWKKLHLPRCSLVCTWEAMSASSFPLCGWSEEKTLAGKPWKVPWSCESHNWKDLQWFNHEHSLPSWWKGSELQGAVATDG